MHQGSIFSIQRVTRTERGYFSVLEEAYAGMASVAAPLSVPNGGIILSTTRLSRIRDIEPVNRTMTVEAGVILADVQPDVVYHLAANSDISAGVADASLDFGDTLMTTIAVRTAMPTRSCASRNGTPASTSRSARSVAFR